MKKYVLPLLITAITCLMSCSSKDDETVFVGPSNRYLIEINGKYGYINNSGDVVISPQFEFARHFREGLAMIGDGSDGPIGFIDTNGKIVIKLEYDDAESFSEGYAQVKIGNGWGFINRKGKVVIEPIYEKTFPFSEGVAAVKEKNGKWGFINQKGDYIVQPQFSDVGSFSEGFAPADGGYISKDGKYRITPQYISSSMFKEGRALVSNRELKYGQSAIIDTLGNIINVINKIPIQMMYSEGRIAVEGNNGKGQGYADRNGNTIILPNYDNACDFHEGLARISINGRWGYIDTLGRTIIEPKLFYAFDFREGLALVAYNETSYAYINREGRIVYEFSNYNPFFTAIYGLTFNNPRYDNNL